MNQQDSTPENPVWRVLLIEIENVSLWVLFFNFPTKKFFSLDGVFDKCLIVGNLYANFSFSLPFYFVCRLPLCHHRHTFPKIIKIFIESCMKISLLMHMSRRKRAMKKTERYLLAPPRRLSSLSNEKNMEILLEMFFLCTARTRKLLPDS